MDYILLLQPIAFVLLLAYVVIKDEVHKKTNSVPIERAFWVFGIAYFSLFLYAYYLSK
jgi:hypothetical protein